MRIRNANIYTEEHRFVRGDATVENGRFVSCTGDPAGEEAVVDAEGMYLIPGLVDIHFHGCKGADMWTVRRKHWMSSHHMKPPSV